MILVFIFLLFFLSYLSPVSHTPAWCVYRTPELLRCCCPCTRQHIRTILASDWSDMIECNPTSIPSPTCFHCRCHTEASVKPSEKYFSFSYSPKKLSTSNNINYWCFWGQSDDYHLRPLMFIKNKWVFSPLPSPQQRLCEYQEPPRSLCPASKGILLDREEAAECKQTNTLKNLQHFSLGYSSIALYRSRN